MCDALLPPLLLFLLVLCVQDAPYFMSDNLKAIIGVANEAAKKASDSSNDDDEHNNAGSSGNGNSDTPGSPYVHVLLHICVDTHVQTRHMPHATRTRTCTHTG